MCLITNQTKPLIAGKDIKCYKFLKRYEGRLRSPFYTFVWEKGKLEKTILHKNGWGEVHKGFHAHMSKKILRKNIREKRAFRDIKRFQRIAKKVFIIPKGSEYYMNENKEEIVSNQIIMK